MNNGVSTIDYQIFGLVMIFLVISLTQYIRHNLLVAKGDLYRKIGRPFGIGLTIHIVFPHPNCPAEIARAEKMILKHWIWWGVGICALIVALRLFDRLI